MEYLKRRVPSCRGGLTCGLAALACLLLSVPASAEDSGAFCDVDSGAPGLLDSSGPISADSSAAISAASTAAPSQPGSSGFWGFTTLLGTGGAGGDFGNLFTKPVTWDYQFFRQQGPWRVGLGIGFDSLKMKDPYYAEPEWGFMQTYLFGTRVFNMKGTVRPYIQLRGGMARIRPRSLLFEKDPLPPDWVSGQQLTASSDGFSVGVVPGIELKLSRAAFLDASVDMTYFKVSETDLSPVGQPPRSSGTAWVGRLGITWIPNGEQHGEGPEGGPRDAWGVKRSYGWAAGEVLAINNLSGFAAEYVRNVDWSETSPRSWWDNLKTGFKYDPDQFKTNQWTHPFNGSQYYNSARSNGVGFWPSTGFALGGAFEWEMAGETQRMSLNDMFATTLGGIALGESQYRLSSEILNNESTGMSRFWKEFGGFLVDPVRGFNRLIRGEATKVADNPVDPQDRRPPNSTTFLALGVRSIGEGSSITHNTDTYGTLLLNHNYGNVFDNPRRGAFDFIDFVAELNTGAKTALGNVQIRGNLASWPLGGTASPNHVLALVQHFDYMNNTAYEFGGQSLGAALSSRFRLSDRVGLQTRLDVDGILMGGINAEYSHLAEVPNPERLREYDYGPGFGTAATVHLVVSGHPLLTALYRFAWIHVTNGSVYVSGTQGSDAEHYIQGGGLRLVIPVKGNLGIGADGFVFLRNSDYALIDSATGQVTSQHIRQRNPQARVYLAYSSRQ